MNDIEKLPPFCRIVGEGKIFIGKQALTYTAGISAKSIVGRGIHMQIVR